MAISKAPPKLKTPISYYGGKQTLAPIILKLIPPHKLYCEPFFGGGAVFFAKEPSAIEIINDTNGMVVNFYKVCQSPDFERLQLLVKQTLHSKQAHEEAVHIFKNQEFFSEVKCAWAFWVLANMSFSNSIVGGYSYDRTKGTTTRKIFNKRLQFTDEIKTRLEKVDIECNDAVAVIKSRDCSDAFFYIDPPYMHANQGHYRGYSETEFENLLVVLSQLKGKFLLSNYPSEILTQYIETHHWYTRSTERRIALVNKPAKTKTEVLVANYPINIDGWA